MLKNNMQEAAAFNEGCDARLNGMPLYLNPHDSLYAAAQWEKGWWDIHNHWGRWVLGRWLYKLIVPMSGFERARGFSGVSNGEAIREVEDCGSQTATEEINSVVGRTD